MNQMSLSSFLEQLEQNKTNETVYSLILCDNRLGYYDLKEYSKSEEFKKDIDKIEIKNDK